MLRMRGYVSAGFFQVRNVNFLNRQQIFIIQVKASTFATYSKNSLYALAAI